MVVGGCAVASAVGVVTWNQVSSEIEDFGPEQVSAFIRSLTKSDEEERELQQAMHSKRMAEYYNHIWGESIVLYSRYILYIFLLEFPLRVSDGFA